ncbi:zinc finger protein with KRAB and SCAN domains 5 isoform X2 [Xyrauchen texanus]|uniref:zinc finger protein with KRAB and SCAN domains 5 isoform X2 n=1 Tax=Xyrauchen texanus TaxID=154827 RepID=UPI0022420DFD|nr:zinc finger protein with KRAB and SCAN domains 5 isoform X2 [Xyrauchen texanus]
MYVCTEMSQISAIMDVLAKAAVAEISQLLQEDSAALHQEIQRRNKEIQGLKTRLLLTETKLQRVTANRCSIGVQVEMMMMDTSVMADLEESHQEKAIATSPVREISEEKPLFPQTQEINVLHLKREESTAPFKPSQETSRAQQSTAEDEEFSGLELEMKIEQVEELVDQKLNQVQAEHRSEVQTHCGADDGDSHVWLSGGDPGKAFDDPESLIDPEQHSQCFTDPYVSRVLMEEPMSSQSTSGLFGSGVVLENVSFNAAQNKDIEYGLNLLNAPRQNSHQPSPSVSDSTAFSRHLPLSSPSSVPKTSTESVFIDHSRHIARPKPFRCEECGKRFTQKTRLITHRWIHTGEKPFRCQLCGKMFSRHDSCLRHVRLHRDGKHAHTTLLS